METSRMIFSLYMSDITYSNYKLLYLHNYLIVLWNKKVLVALASYRFMLLNIQPFKIKNNSKHFKSSRMAPKHANAKWQIMQRFIHYLDIYSGEKTRIYSERPHLASGCLLKCFIRWQLVQDNHFWVVSRVVVLYRFDCTKQFFQFANKLDGINIFFVEWEW